MCVELCAYLECSSSVRRLEEEFLRREDLSSLKTYVLRTVLRMKRLQSTVLCSVLKLLRWTSSLHTYEIRHRPSELKKNSSRQPCSSVSWLQQSSYPKRHPKSADSGVKKTSSQRDNGVQCSHLTWSTARKVLSLKWTRGDDLLTWGRWNRSSPQLWRDDSKNNIITIPMWSPKV